MKRIKAVVSVLMILPLISCATIMHGGRQDIYVTSNPSGAVVRVNNTVTTTPGRIILDRKQSRYTLIFEKEGYRPVEVDLRRTVDGWLFGNILLLQIGIIGIVIDFLTSAAYKITPADVSVDFYEENAHLFKHNKDVVVFVDMEHLKSIGVNVEDLERL